MDGKRYLTDYQDMSAEDRLDALAEVLAEGFLSLVENGLLEPPTPDPVKPPDKGKKLIRKIA